MEKRISFVYSETAEVSMMIVVTVRRERRWTPAGTTPLPANLRPIPAQRDLRHSANCFHQPCKPLDRGDYNRCGVLQMTTRTCAVLVFVAAMPLRWPQAASKLKSTTAPRTRRGTTHLPKSLPLLEAQTSCKKLPTPCLDWHRTTSRRDRGRGEHPRISSNTPERPQCPD